MAHIASVTVGLDTPAASLSADQQKLQGLIPEGTHGTNNGGDTFLDQITRGAGAPNRPTATATVQAPSRASVQLSPKPAAGWFPPGTPEDQRLVVSIGGVEMSLAAAKRLGYAVEDRATGRTEPSQAFVASKMQEAQQANAQADAATIQVEPAALQNMNDIAQAAEDAGLVIENVLAVCNDNSRGRLATIAVAG